MKYITAIVFILLLIIACNKGDLLKENPGTAIIVPTTPGDMQALLDNEDIFAPTTSLNFIGADEFYFSDSFERGMNLSQQGAYLWEDFTFGEDETVADWNNAYEQIYYSNNVLEGIRRLQNSIDSKILKPLEGDALFKRGFAFFNAAQVFAIAYDSSTAGKDKGIPLRLTIDRKEPLPRSTVAETYQQIIDDLKAAADLLPPTVELVHRNRSSRPAAYALLARVYLSMNAYGFALDAAKESLKLYDSLIDFNTGIVSPTLPFTATNSETLYQSKMTSIDDVLYDGLIKKEVYVDSLLIREYKGDDLRPSVFFTKSVSPATFKSSYFGKLAPFTGLGTPELYLIAAECSVRQGDINMGMSYLNKLLKSRWKTGQYIPYIATTTNEALNVILLERRKELVFRGTRWTDIRRLNKKNPFLTLTRTVQGIKYELLPNSPRYALPIPEQVLRLNNRIDQNPR